MFSKIPPSLPSGKDESVRIRMFFKAHTDVLESNLSAHEKLILIAIESWNDDRDCVYGAERLARYASCCVRTAKTVTAALEKKGLITITPRTGDTNIYKAASSVADILRNAAPVQELHAPRANAARPPVQELHPTRATVAPNKNIHKINDKIIDKIIVADAPLPTEPELKNPLIDLDSVKEPLEIHEAPPIPAAPPKAQKPKKPDLPLDAVDALEVPDEVKAAAKRWFEHKQLIKDPIKVRTLLREITKYGHGLPVVVQRSISSNYDGLWPIKYQDLDEVADEAVNKLFVCMSEDGDWVEAGRSNPLLRDSLTEYMGANGIDDKQTFKNKAEGSGRTFILKDIKKIYIRKMKQTFNNI